MHPTSDGLTLPFPCSTYSERKRLLHNRPRFLLKSQFRKIHLSPKSTRLENLSKAPSKGLYGMFRIGIMTPPEFFAAIIKLDVFVICSEGGNPNSALFLQHPDGNSRLAFFSTIEKAKKLFESHPQFSHVYELPLRDILIGLPPTSGFVMNPTFEAMTMQATPEQVQHIKSDFLSTQP
jgi:hypothetical protein